MDWPAHRMPAPPILTPFHDESLGGLHGNRLDQAASASWPADNLALYYPFRLTSWATVYQLLFFVGATSGGNLDVAIYDSAKNRLVAAGSTAMSGSTNAVQELNVTDTLLPPGDYLLGVVATTSGTCFRVSTADELLLGQVPVYEEALGGTTLPAAAAPVLSTQGSPPVMAVGAQLRSVF